MVDAPGGPELRPEGWGNSTQMATRANSAAQAESELALLPSDAKLGF